ncbi:hypothetical protein LCGC14_0365600 [marine sediment metagenome]|uniref:GLUG domain-containing protein n=1 Tax=marine sediment metagenome TaxID=412755 RepID=A0A0F9TCM2_9ZZZZ
MTTRGEITGGFVGESNGVITGCYATGSNQEQIREEPTITRTIFRLVFPIHKRIWRFLMLIIRGWCYFD